MNSGRKKNPNLIIALVLLAIVIIIIIPLLYAIVTSFKLEKDIIGPNPSFFPHQISLDNYKYIFEHSELYLKYYLNSTIITVFSVLITIILSTMAGYAFARLPFKGRDTILGFILFIVTFPLAVLLVPIYIMEYKMGLLNTNLG
jgi:ABC-type glycerol-3-phosphate transport system permease component